MTPLCPRNEHLSRRALLKGTLATATGGTLMNWGGLFRSSATAAEVSGQQKHCILLWMNGGCSQFETFDMKPGRYTGGQFRPVSTNVAGTQVCELLPKMAGQMDKLAVIRSMRTSQVDHPGGIHLMHTAYSPAPNVRFPELGAVVAKYHGTETGDLPGFIKIASNGNSGSGFLGPRYQPFSLGDDGRLPPFSTSVLAADAERRRHELRAFVEQTYRREHQAETARLHHGAYEAARRLQQARKAFDIDQEWPKFSDLYGDSTFGRGCLLARQLIEQGVPFVEVGQSSYDSHADNFDWHRGLLPCMEHAWAGLLTDLEQRGLLERTLVVWMGEIGRTPRINNRAGRDHYVRAWSTALAGCGIKGGLVYGKTDADGIDVVEDQVTEGDFFATIYQALGIDPETEHYAGSRPVPIAPFGSRVVQDLLEKFAMSEFHADKFQPACRLMFEGAWPTGVAFLDGGRRLAAGNQEGQLFVWDLPEELEPAKDKADAPPLSPVRQLVGHTNGITRLLAAADGRTLISASFDHSIRVWDTAAAAEGTAEVVLKAKPRGRTGDEDGPGITVETQTAARVLTGHDDWVYAIGLSGDGARLVSGDGKGLTIVRDFTSGEEIARWGPGFPGNWITAAVLSPDGQRAFTAEFHFRRGSFDRPPAQARFWNADDGSEVLDVLQVQFPDVKARDNSFGYAQKWGSFMKSGFVAADFSPDGKLLCAGQGGETDTGQVQVIEVETGKLVRSIAGHRYGVTDCRFSPDGQFILSTGRDTTVQICRLEDGKEVARLSEPRGGQFKDWLYALDLSPDARRLAATDIAGHVQVWYATG